MSDDWIHAQGREAAKRLLAQGVQGGVPIESLRVAWRVLKSGIRGAKGIDCWWCSEPMNDEQPGNAGGWTVHARCVDEAEAALKAGDTGDRSLE